MKNEEIHKLLGGYATNTLTESERRALFEAALEDQELFNALQDEQALKQLLADPASREAIQRALERPLEKQHSTWWSRRWLWGGMVSAAAAAVLIIAVVHQNRPGEKRGRIEIASTQEPAKPLLEPNAPIGDQEVKKAPEQISPRTARREPKAKEHVRDNLAPQSIGQLAPSAAAPPPPTTAERLTVEQPEPKVAGGVIGGAAPAANGFLANAKLDPLRYSLLKKDGQGLYSPIPSQAELRPGDSVRLNISPAVSGYLSLYQLIPSGEWKRLFPESPEGTHVTANTDYTVPEVGIEVQNGAQKFRISLTVDEVGKRAKTASKQSVRAAAAQPATGTVPLTVDLMIAPGKVP
jgi:hypothetical protein